MSPNKLHPFLRPSGSVTRLYLAQTKPLSRTFTAGFRFRDSQPDPKSKDAPLISAQRTRKSDQLSFWPFLFIFLAGTGLFILTVRSREGSHPKSRAAATQPSTGTPLKKKRSDPQTVEREAREAREARRQQQTGSNQE